MRRSEAKPSRAAVEAPALRVLVAGAGGMLGQDLVAASARRGHEVLGLARAELDITDARAVEDLITDARPDAIVNCAAWTDVDGAEANEREAMRVNDTAAALLATAAAAHDASVLFVSSDYVFDGEKGAPYVESDLTGAISAYGRTKQAGETSVAIANPRHFIVRSSWLFGVGGGNFVETMLRVGGEQSEVIVVSDQVGTPTYTPHLAAGLAELIEGEDYGIHHMPASGSCSWFEYAQEIFDQEALECRVMAGTTEMLARPAPRPRYSVLGSERPDRIELPHWRRGLAEYLGERAGVGRGTADRGTPGRGAEEVPR
ncbi:MAG: dTDP-4-dehydrorhamnose reductase [Solirubrobacterales bacterium]|nr:dTDP-4-dehydrorhamnose reductase [Solirubrobacterales bacterium]